MFILLIFKSLITSKFIIEIQGIAILIIYIDLISCLLKVECYVFSSFGNAKNIVCIVLFVIQIQRVREQSRTRIF